MVLIMCQLVHKDGIKTTVKTLLAEKAFARAFEVAIRYRKMRSMAWLSFENAIVRQSRNYVSASQIRAESKEISLEWRNPAVEYWSRLTYGIHAAIRAG